MPLREMPPASRSDAMVKLAVPGPSLSAQLTLPVGDHITHDIQRSGTYYERAMLDAIRIINPIGTYVDVGAHYGNHSVFFGLECAARRIISIEPNPDTYAGLVRNLAANGLAERATAINAAIHLEWRRVESSLPDWTPGPTNPAISNTGMSRVHPVEGDDAVPAFRLDEILSGVDDLAAIKVDVEGDAFGVVRSGVESISRSLPVLVIEALSDDEQGALIQMLVPLGYRAFGPYNATPTWIWAAA
jgi:FkbM family methyltransferase